MSSRMFYQKNGVFVDKEKGVISSNTFFIIHDVFNIHDNIALQCSSKKTFLWLRKYKTILFIKDLLSIIYNNLIGFSYHIYFFSFIYYIFMVSNPLCDGNRLSMPNVLYSACSR